MKVPVTETLATMVQDALDAINKVAAQCGQAPLHAMVAGDIGEPGGCSIWQTLQLLGFGREIRVFRGCIKGLTLEEAALLRAAWGPTCRRSRNTSWLQPDRVLMPPALTRFVARFDENKLPTLVRPVLALGA